MTTQPRFILIGLLAACLVGAAGYGLYATGMRRGMEAGGTMQAAGTSAPPATEAAAAASTGAAAANESDEDATRRHMASGIKAGDVDPATGKRILYYHDPMVPGNRFDKPAKSPF